jgi:alpha-beta hydrolase superfamily lysophospholipase
MTRAAVPAAGRGFSLRRNALIVVAVSALLDVHAFAAGRPVSLAASDGTSLAGLFYEASSRPAPAVLLVHMLGRSKDEWIQTAERLQDAGVTALAIDLRGHGQSGGYGSDLPAMVGDVQSALRWLAGRPGVRASAMAIAGASLGANLAALVAAGDPSLVGVALISPSLDYRGLRLDPSLLKKLAGRPMWLAASTEDPFALRTIKELAGDGVGREQRLSSVRGHGSALLAADQDLARALVDWLRARLIF